jgi:hypothetical protein
MTWGIAKVAASFVCIAAVLMSTPGCMGDVNRPARQSGSRDNSQDRTQANVEPASDLPPPEEPQLAEPGDWAADFNDAQIACYQGSMSACDSIWLSNRVLIDSWLDDYGFLCGGRYRVDQGSARLARTREFDHMRCTEIFPGHD